MTDARDELAELIREYPTDPAGAADAILAAGWRAPEPTVCGSRIIYRGVRLACDLTPNGIPHEHHGKPRTPGPHIYWGDVDDGLAVD